MATNGVTELKYAVKVVDQSAQGFEQFKARARAAAIAPDKQTATTLRFGSKVFGEGSGLGKVGEVAGGIGGGIAAAGVAVGMLGVSMAKAIVNASELRKEYQAGKMTFAEYSDAAIAGVPIFGKIASAVGFVRDAYRSATGEAKRLAQENNAIGLETKRIESLSQSARDAAKSYRDMAEERRKFMRDYTQAGAVGPQAGINTARNAADDEQAAIQKRLREQNDAEQKRVNDLNAKAVEAYLGGKITSEALDRIQKQNADDRDRRFSMNQSEADKSAQAARLANAPKIQEAEENARQAANKYVEDEEKRHAKATTDIAAERFEAQGKYLDAEKARIEQEAKDKSEAVKEQIAKDREALAGRGIDFDKVESDRLADIDTERKRKLSEAQRNSEERLRNRDQSATDDAERVQSLRDRIAEIKRGEDRNDPRYTFSSNEVDASTSGISERARSAETRDKALIDANKQTAQNTKQLLDATKELSRELARQARNTDKVVN